MVLRKLGEKAFHVVVLETNDGHAEGLRLSLSRLSLRV